MKLIKPSFEIREQPSGLEGVYKQIEGAGRVCYKSEDKIAEGTAKAFVDRMIASGHGAMLEHGTVYLKCETEVINRYIHPEVLLIPKAVRQSGKILTSVYLNNNEDLKITYSSPE